MAVDTSGLMSILDPGSIDVGSGIKVIFTGSQPKGVVTLSYIGGTALKFTVSQMLSGTTLVAVGSAEMTGIVNAGAMKIEFAGKCENLKLSDSSPTFNGSGHGEWSGFVANN